MNSPRASDPRHTEIPSLVRVKAGALDRMGVYAARHDFHEVAVLFSEGFDESLLGRLTRALTSASVRISHQEAVGSIEFDDATCIVHRLPANTMAVIGIGGGKALDVAKYVGFLAGLPYLAVPTSLSNDGFCSPQSSLAIAGRRRSMASAVPFGVVIDTAVCLHAPRILWHSGVGDLVSKLTAVADWKLAFHACGTPIDDFAALLSDASVYQFIARPIHDLEGMKLLGTALLLNGISMSISGSSRRASGSEHLISHALDAISARPRLHGLQVGVATYLVSLLQGENSKVICDLFEATGFWKAIAEDPFDRSEWMDAARLAPDIKADFYTILSSRDCLPQIRELLGNDPCLQKCFAA
ncbi:MAG: iron-containing alcohol dehydrogenase family protein [Chthoniobacterales bacterium]